MGSFAESPNCTICIEILLHNSVKHKPKSGTLNSPVLVATNLAGSTGPRSSHYSVCQPLPCGIQLIFVILWGGGQVVLASPSTKQEKD